MAETTRDLPCGRGEGEEEQIEESSDAVEEEDGSAISSAFLAELNLVMMVAFLTISGDEFLQPEEDPERIVAGEDQRVVAKLKRRRRRQRHPDEFKAADRQAISRSQTKILDSRHGRKM